MEKNIYTLEFWDKMLRQNSSTAEQINKIRWDFVLQNTRMTPAKETVVLDYGSGVGWFRAFAPKGVTVDTYDIGQFPQTGIRHESYALLTMWDVLEHLPNLKEIEPYLTITEHVAISVPIKPSGVPLSKWKHFKPREHLHYYTEDILNSVFKSYGFDKEKSGTPECPPRSDIVSILYRRYGK